jgi:hypothetical protein
VGSFRFRFLGIDGDSMMNHPPLMEVRGLQDQGFGGLGGPSMMNYPPFERACSVLRYEGRKVSHAKVSGPRAERAGLSCWASSRRGRLAPSGVNPSAEQHGQTRPAATSIRNSDDTVTAAPTPCPRSAARYGVQRKFRVRKSSAAPRVCWVPRAARASTTAQRLAYSGEPMSRFASPAGRGGH